MDRKAFVNKLLYAQYSIEYNEMKESIFSRSLWPNSELYYTIRSGAKFLKDFVYGILSSSGFPAQT